MKRFFFLGLYLAMASTVKAQGLYDVSKISPELMKNASVVLRNQEQIYEVKSPGNASYSCHMVLTILNKSGESASDMHEFYDSFSTISGLKATLYDSKGTKVKDYRTSDFTDRSAVSGGSMYEDSRVKFLNFMYTTFPYTIEYSYTMDFNGILSYPGWNPVGDWAFSVEKSSYVFKIPQQMSFKYLKSKGLETDSTLVKGKMEYRWSCANVAALEYEQMSVGLKDVVPWVAMAPNQFEFDHSAANIEDWKNLGAWLYGLSKDLQELPPAAKAKVQELVKGVQTPQEKIGILYHYLQNSTRYVSVQLGIGGYVPFAASKVSGVGYGDCKGLSNYMKAMLKEAGISSSLVVIGHDLPSLNPEYASMNQANHMILCVPLEKDTTWLECTSPYTPAGFIGQGNSDKTVLLITEAGGKLVRTPVYRASDNSQKRTTRVTLDPNGSAGVEIETEYNFAQFEDNLRVMLMEPVEQRKQIMNHLGIPNMKIEALSYAQPDRKKPSLQEKIALRCSGLLSSGGDKLFLTLNMLNRQEGAAVPIESRKTYFAVGYGYNDEDEIVYELPKGYKVEFVPKEIVIESEFGKYTAGVVVKDDALIYKRVKTMNSKSYPPEKYNEYVAFSKKIFQADKQKAILAKVE